MWWVISVSPHPLSSCPLHAEGERWIWTYSSMLDSDLTEYIYISFSFSRLIRFVLQKRPCSHAFLPNNDVSAESSSVQVTQALHKLFTGQTHLVENALSNSVLLKDTGPEADSCPIELPGCQFVNRSMFDKRITEMFTDISVLTNIWCWMFHCRTISLNWRFYITAFLERLVFPALGQGWSEIAFRS